MMVSPLRATSFKRLIQICLNHKIANLHFENNLNASLEYGPLGSLLKQNIFKEWLYSLLNNGDVTLFPLELVKPCKQNNLIHGRAHHLSEDGFVKDIIQNHFNFSSSIGHNLPFGFISYGAYLNHINDTKIKQIKDFSLENFKSWSHISLVFFCPPKKSMHWFHYWSKQRYIWWRKFSSVPSQFSMSEVLKPEDDVHQLSLLLQFPWGKEPLESISLYENKCFKPLFYDYVKQHKIADNMVPSAIVCESGLDLAVLAYLFNSFAERWRDGQIKNILQLHYKFAPYKVCLLLESEKTENENKLKNIANHLSKEFREANILIYPSAESKNLLLKESDFSCYDEMAVPYIIVLNENSLSTGIVGVRNRDTSLQEQVHITELTQKLQKYLKIER